MSIITINNQKAYEVYMEITMYMHYKTIIICRHTVNEFNAVGGAAVVMNISNGEIISFVSLPYFAPNKKLGQNGKCLFNMITSSAIEPRTSAKIFKASMAMEKGKITYLLNLMQDFL